MVAPPAAAVSRVATRVVVAALLAALVLPSVRACSSLSSVTTLAGGGGDGVTFGAADGQGTSALFGWSQPGPSLPTTTGGPTGGVVDAASGILYLADYGSKRIVAVSPDGAAQLLAGNTAAASSVLPPADGQGGSAVFGGPVAVTLDPATGTLYASDCDNNLLRTVSLTGFVATLAGGGSIGGTAFGSANGLGAAATLYCPWGVAWDNAASIGSSIRRGGRGGGRVCVCVLRPSSCGTIACRAARARRCPQLRSNGTQASESLATPTLFPCALMGFLLHPASLLTLPRPPRTVYIADAGNNLIRASTPAGLVSTLAGQTIPGYVDGDGAAASFNLPAGLALDTAGARLFVADQSNFVIRVMVRGWCGQVFAASLGISLRKVQGAF